MKRRNSFAFSMNTKTPSRQVINLDDSLSEKRGRVCGEDQEDEEGQHGEEAGENHEERVEEDAVDHDPMVFGVANFE
jgi:hypothetical protein